MFKPVLGPDQVVPQMLGLRANDGLLDLELLPCVLFCLLDVVKLQGQPRTFAVSMGPLGG